MDIRSALKDQYHAGIAMLRQCVERCPDDVWISGTHPRTFWRIAFHAAFYAHLYLGQNEAAFQPWSDRRNDFPELWAAPWDLEPFELPPDAEVSLRQEILGYVAYVDGLIDPTVDGLDLDTGDSGFDWYKNITKLSHELMNVRHLQGHVGQLSELLMACDVDIDWVSRRPAGQ